MLGVVTGTGVMNTFKRVTGLLERPAIAWLIFVLAIILTTPSFLVGFASDDHFVRMVVKGFPGMPDVAAQEGFHTVPWDLFAFATGDADNNKEMMARGLLPWWTYPEMRQRVMHPFSGVTHWIDFSILPDASWLAHLHNMIVFGLVAFPALLFYRSLPGAAWVAGLATWLYMIDDARGMPAGWIVNRYIFHAVIFAFILLWAHHRWRSQGWRAGAVVGPASLVMGFTCGEAMAAACAYLFAYECFIARGPLFQRFMALVPYGIVVVLWRIVYTALGFGSFGSGIYIDMGKQPIAFIEKVVSHWPVLMLGMFGKPNSTWWTFVPPGLQWLWWGGAVVFIIVLLWAARRVIAADPVARFALVGAGIAALPLCAVIADDRLLVFPGIGGSLFLARVFQHFVDRDVKVSSAIVIPLVMIHLVIAPLLLPIESMRQSMITAFVDRANAGIQQQDIAPDTTIVVVNPPSDWIPTLFPIVQSANEEPLPEHFFALTAGGGEVTVTRIDETTFEIKQDGGMLPYPFGQLHRADDIAPWSAGDRVEIDGMTVEVVSVTEDRRPLHVRYVLEAEIDKQRLYTWDGFTYQPFTIGVGETKTLPPAVLNGPFAKRDNTE